MHDLDRTQNMFESEYQDTEMFEFADEGEQEGEYQDEFGYEAESAFDEIEEMELAAELLEITDEAELDQFLSKLIKKVGRGVGSFVKSGVGRQIGGMLKGVAKKALPMVGGALGNMVVPGLGGMAGSQLASAAGGMFGLELEGLSPQDQEYEVARRFVRFAGAAAKNAANASSNTPLQQIARRAVIEAAQNHAPGLLRAVSGIQHEQSSGLQQPGNGSQQANGAQQGTGSRPAKKAQYGGGRSSASGPGQATRTGRWVRRGRKIILFEV